MASVLRFRHVVAGALLCAAYSSPSAQAASATRVVSVDTAITPSGEPGAAPGRPLNGEAPRTPTSQSKGELSVTVDRAKVIRMPERTQTVIIGNPAIADVAVQKNGIVVLTGKSFGVTNFIALDGAGNLLAETTVSVNAPNDATLTVQRGLERFTYSCTPACQPSVALGDSDSFFNGTKGQADAHSSFANQK